MADEDSRLRGLLEAYDIIRDRHARVVSDVLSLKPSLFGRRTKRHHELWGESSALLDVSFEICGRIINGPPEG